VFDPGVVAYSFNDRGRPISTGKAIAVIVAVTVAGAVAWQVVEKQTRPPKVSSAALVPPGGARFVPDDVGPEEIVTSVAAVKKPVRAEAADAWRGLWVRAPGWTAPIEELSEDRSGTTVALTRTSAGIIGNGFTIVAASPLRDLNLKKGDIVTVSGEISDVEVISSPLVPAPILRVRLVTATIRPGPGGK
jgi:hypothetical protein